MMTEDISSANATANATANAAANATANAAANAAPGGVQSPIQSDDILSEGELNSEEILARTILYALDEGAEKLRQCGCFDPFTILIKGEELFIEDHPGDDEEGSYASANRTILLMEKLGDAYVFCYDAVVDLDSGQCNALIVEYAKKDDELAQINIRLYRIENGEYVFDESLYQAGETESFFKGKTNRAQSQGEFDAEFDAEFDKSEDTNKVEAID